MKIYSSGVISINCSNEQEPDGNAGGNITETDESDIMRALHAYFWDLQNTAETNSHQDELSSGRILALDIANREIAWAKYAIERSASRAVEYLLLKKSAAGWEVAHKLATAPDRAPPRRAAQATQASRASLQAIERA